MISIFRKEIVQFFSSLVGYMAIGVFLLLCGLFLFVFNSTSILDYGYASMEALFNLAPYVFLILIPAITMRSFAEEKANGTIEILLTRPVTEWQVVFAKYLAAFVLVVFAILPTLIYYFTVYNLGSPPGNVDSGGVWGSYLGLLFLASLFVSIGVFASSITNNQIVAFIVAIALCWLVYDGFNYIAQLPFLLGKGDNFIQNLGIASHYQSISRGVVDTRDLVYFVSASLLFLLFSKTALESRKW